MFWANGQCSRGNVECGVLCQEGQNYPTGRLATSCFECFSGKLRKRRGEWHLALAIWSYRLLARAVSGGRGSRKLKTISQFHHHCGRKFDHGGVSIGSSWVTCSSWDKMVRTARLRLCPHAWIHHCARERSTVGRRRL